MTQNNEIIIYQNEDKKIEVFVKEEAIWLSLNQIAELFDMIYKRQLFQSILKRSMTTVN